jgi:hypothetical protein
MDEKELARQRDRYWMLSAVLMVIIALLLLYIGGLHAANPGKAAWKSSSFNDSSHADTAHFNTVSNSNQRSHLYS